MALAFLSTSLSAGVAAAAEPPSPASQPASNGADLEKARTHFLQAVQFYNNGDYKLSLIEFRRSYELSGNYRILYNIGQVNQQLGNYTRALAALEQYLRDSGEELADERREEVHSTVALLKQRVAHVRVVTNVVAPEVLIDGFPVDVARSNGSVTVDPGDHRVEVRKTGYQPAGNVVSLAAGDDTELRILLHEIPPPTLLAVQPRSSASPARDSTWLWIGWSGTAAAALGAGITGVLASMQASELADLRNSPSSTEGQRESVGRRAKTFAITSDVLTATAVATGAVSLYLTLRPRTREGDEQRPTPSATVALGPRGVAFRQTF